MEGCVCLDTNLWLLHLGRLVRCCAHGASHVCTCLHRHPLALYRDMRSGEARGCGGAGAANEGGGLRGARDCELTWHHTCLAMAAQF